MNPNEYKQTLKTPPNKSAIKKVVEKYQQFKGQDNLGPRPNRNERNIIKYLRDHEIMPIGGTSEEAGRFVAEYQEELTPTIAEYKSRIAEMSITIRALENMQKRLPRKSDGQPQVKQSPLFDLENEPKSHDYYYVWER